MQVVPNGIDVAGFMAVADRKPHAVKLGLAEGRPVVGVASRLVEHRKGVHVFVAAHGRDGADRQRDTSSW